MPKNSGLQWLSYRDWAIFWIQRTTEQCDIYYHNASKQLRIKNQTSLLYEMKQDSRAFAIVEPNDWDSQKAPNKFTNIPKDTRVKSW